MSLTLPLILAIAQAATLPDIRFAEPFVYPDTTTGVYYLYGSGYNAGEGSGFVAYTSTDLTNWSDPEVVYKRPAKFWAEGWFRSPDLFFHKGKYYLFGSLRGKTTKGIQVFSGESLKGPFLPLGEGVITPEGWDTMDASLFVDPVGQPWLVFCHDWIQVGEGEVCAAPLSPDFKSFIADPEVLFRATDAKWSVAHTDQEKTGLVTAGPFAYRAKNGALLMLWSGYSARGFALGYAKSESGNILGPWRQIEPLLYDSDGGHGMVFRDFTGETRVVLQTPSRFPDHRVQIFTLTEDGDKLTLAR
jgi:hypothetical protein